MAIFQESEGTHAGHSNLRKGDTGVEVQTLQESLNLFFGSVLKVDGIFGDRTEEFVKKFQSACKITINGIVGQETWLCLDQIKSHIGKSHPIQRQGDKGDYVKYLQVWLNGYYSSQLAVDGNFGYKTEDLVKHFQQQRSLTVDGIVGSQTWSQLEQPNWDV
ncbi:MAG: peptidoglycan-binding protein [Scytonema sp. PMC 1069.18]|nr:peptidoglycan-binding protein [Scytonema sp. PMC 1069.18]MEC4886353.1 peptidoglycan-binding protein [Scytonema sp. PMC 1070.18]